MDVEAKVVNQDGNTVLSTISLTDRDAEDLARIFELGVNREVPLDEPQVVYVRLVAY